MKFSKLFQNHSLYEAYIVGSVFPETEGKPVISYCKLQDEVHYNRYVHHYNVLDILYANATGEKKVDSTVLDPSLGYTPIGICVAKTGFFGENEPARFMSLKYMNYTTPETGSLTAEEILWGNYNNNISTINDISIVSADDNNEDNSSGYLSDIYSSVPSYCTLISSLFDSNGNWNTSILGTVNQYAVTDIDGKNKTEKILVTATAQTTWQTDTSISNESDANYAPAACCCARYHTLGTQAGDWYLGACGEMCMIAVKKTDINTKLAAINAIYPNDCITTLNPSQYNNSYHTSTESDSDAGYGYTIEFNEGYVFKYTYSGGLYYVLAMLQY